MIYILINHKNCHNRNSNNSKCNNNHSNYYLCLSHGHRNHDVAAALILALIAALCVIAKLPTDAGWTSSELCTVAGLQLPHAPQLFKEGSPTFHDISSSAYTAQTPCIQRMHQLAVLVARQSLYTRSRQLGVAERPDGCSLVILAKRDHPQQDGEKFFWWPPPAKLASKLQGRAQQETNQKMCCLFGTGSPLNRAQGRRVRQTAGHGTCCQQPYDALRISVACCTSTDRSAWRGTMSD